MVTLARHFTSDFYFNVTEASVTTSTVVGFFVVFSLVGMFGVFFWCGFVVFVLVFPSFCHWIQNTTSFIIFENRF